MLAIEDNIKDNDSNITKIFKHITNAYKYRDSIKIKEEENISTILQIFDETKKESLYVIDDKNKVIGIITKDELVYILNKKFLYDKEKSEV